MLEKFLGDQHPDVVKCRTNYNQVKIGRPKKPKKKKSGGKQRKKSKR